MMNEHFNAGDFFNCDLFVCKYEHRQYFYPAGSIFSNWEQFEKKRYYHWEFLSMGLLVFFSVMISSGLKIFPSDNLSLLGVIPMFIGVKIWLDNKFESKAQTEEKLQVKKRQIISVTLIGLANGADNIGIYVPVFSQYSYLDLVITIVCFAFMLSLWCYLGRKIVSFPWVRGTLQKYKHIFIPGTFLIIGIIILLG